MKKQKLIEEIQRHQKDSHITCKQCFDVAQKYGVSLRTVGHICNENSIKIRACQIGCFK